MSVHKIFSHVSLHFIGFWTLQVVYPKVTLLTTSVVCFVRLPQNYILFKSMNINAFPMRGYEIGPSICHDSWYILRRSQKYLSSRPPTKHRNKYTISIFFDIQKIQVTATNDVIALLQDIALDCNDIAYSCECEWIIFTNQLYIYSFVRTQ